VSAASVFGEMTQYRSFFKRLVYYLYNSAGVARQNLRRVCLLRSINTGCEL
jgi:hypothetical protein